MQSSEETPAPEEREIFLAALELASEEDRSRYLDQACEGRPELRERLEQLLQSQPEASSFMEHSPAGLALTLITEESDWDSDGSVLNFDFLTSSNKPGCLGTIGAYEIVGVIGRGAFGIVFRAFDRKLNRVVAIKVMAPELAMNPMAVRRFSREAQAAASVIHDHVITLHAIDETSKPPLIVMEYVDGESLDKHIERRGALEPVEILRIGMQIAAGLSSAHRLGLIHRDIKPANILLEKGSKRVKITDFGLARAVDDIGMTQTGTIAGTPQYMSPEQGLGKPLDRRTDLFSLGSVLYTLCTGRAPFRADSTVATLKRVCDDEPRKIRELNPDIPPWLCNLVMKLLRKDPEARFQSAEEVEEVFRACLADVQSAESGHQTPKAALVAANPFQVAGNSAWPLFVAIAVQLVALIGSFLRMYVEIESILFSGPVFGLGLGAAIAVLAYLHAARASYMAFGLSSIALVLAIFLIILGFGLGPQDPEPILAIVFFYCVVVIPWGIQLLRNFSNATPSHAKKPPVLHVVRAGFIVQLCGMIATFALCAWDEEPILVMGPLFGLGMGLALTYLCFYARLPGRYISFGAFTLAYTLFFSFLIAADFLNIRQETEVLLLTLGYSVLAFPWAVYLLNDLRRLEESAGAQEATTSSPLVSFTLAMQVFGIALATAIFSLDFRSIIAVIPLFYIVIGITSSMLVLRDPERHRLTKIFALSAPILGVLVMITFGMGSAFFANLPRQEFVAWAFAAILTIYCLCVIPLGLWCVIRETKLLATFETPKFSIWSGMIATTLLAVAFGFARPSLNFGAVAFVANALLGLSILVLVGLLCYLLYKRSGNRLVLLQWLGICLPTFSIGLVYMVLVSEFDLAVNLRPVAIQFENLPDVLPQPINLAVTRVDTNETDIVEIRQKDQVVGMYRTGDFELRLVNAPAYSLGVEKLRIYQRSYNQVTLSPRNVAVQELQESSTVNF